MKLHRTLQTDKQTDTPIGDLALNVASFAVLSIRHTECCEQTTDSRRSDADNHRHVV